MVTLFTVVFPLLIAGIFLSRAYAEVDEGFVHTWANAHGLTLTTANRPLVWWYLRNARVLRTWGVLAGVMLPPLASIAFGRAEQGVSTTWWCLFGGHLAGTLFAEVALRRPSPSGTRIATLERREVRQYLPARLRFAPLAITAVSTLVVVAGFATGDLTASTRSTAYFTVGAAAAVTGLLAWCQRWIVTRPQPFTDAELVDADDALRSQSVHMLAAPAPQSCSRSSGCSSASSRWTPIRPCRP